MLIGREDGRVSKLDLAGREVVERHDLVGGVAQHCLGVVRGDEIVGEREAQLHLPGSPA